MKDFSVGDFVIYRKPKMSPHPGPRAQSVYPAEHGEDYSYSVDKFWTVAAVVDEQTIEIETRTGKRHRLRTDDPHLRKAGVLQRLLNRSRFPQLKDNPRGVTQ